RLLHAGKSSDNPVARGLANGAFGLRDAARTAIAFVRDGGYRTQVLLKTFRGRQLHQTTVLTWADRYPAIFGAVRDYLAGREGIRILSFGCSTGEEVLTLRSYFPKARIVGAEINPRSLAVCRARAVDEGITFIESTTKNVRDAGPFDAIFCMAVLQRNPHAVESQGITDLSGTYPFARFDEQVSEFARLLAPGGVLVIHHTQYIFSDATSAGSFKPLAAQPEPRPDGPRFDRQSQRIPGDVVTPSIWVKVQ
ncbi:MAG: methyltransferase domain-containing protein, partial [Gemmatimonadaceae bacterium]